MSVERRLREQSQRFQKTYEDLQLQMERVRNVVRVFGMQTVLYEAALNKIVLLAQEGDFDQVEKIAQDALTQGNDLMAGANDNEENQS